MSQGLWDSEPQEFQSYSKYGFNFMHRWLPWVAGTNQAKDNFLFSIY